MTRIAYALSTLIRQVETQKKNAEYELGEPDGLKVVRSATFDKSTSKWLKPLIDVARDDRIADVSSRSGQTTVTVVPDIRADRKGEFLLGEVDAILNPEDERDVRRKELQGIAVADLREQYGYEKDWKKADIIDDVLRKEQTPSEGFAEDDDDDALILVDENDDDE